MKRIIVGLVFAMGTSLYAQESQMGADFRHEKEDLQNSCSGSFAKALFGCAQTLFTDHPLHIAVGSLAPQNGTAVGIAFVSHYTPNERWRLSWNADAVASKNMSWRAGIYMKAIYTGEPNITVITNPNQKTPVNLVHEYPVINLYAQSSTLNTVDYYGLGNSTAQSSESIFGIQETIAGVNAVMPIIRKWNVSAFGEMNGRFVDIRREPGEATPSIDQLYTPASAPGLISQPGFLQLGEGIRIRPTFLSDHVQLNYQATFQEFAAPGSHYSFNRFTADLSHTFPIYGNLLSSRASEFNGPDECASAPGSSCPGVSRNRSGSFGIRLVYTESFVSAGNSIPFYFQPTIGGSDIDGSNFLPSYRDYRFRAPNLFVLRGTFEHSIWGPLGFEFLADEGKVALTHNEIDWKHLKHSFAAGLTLRAGGLPAVSLLFAWGGTEGTHTIASVDPSLLGGGARPSLY